jgi:hypothetical protein
VKLETYLEKWKTILSGSGPTDAVAGELGVSLDRLKTYRRFIWDHYQDAIRLMYGRVEKVAPESLTLECIRAYYSKFPPNEWNLNQLAKHYPAYLKELPVPTAVCELAEYEWAEFCVLRDLADEAQLIADLAPGELLLHPSLYLLNFQNQISSWVHDIDELEENAETDSKPVYPTAPTAGPETLLMSRICDPYQIRLTQPSLGALSVIQTLSDGKMSRDAALAAAAEVCGLPEVELKSETDFLIKQGILLTAPPISVNF